MTDQAIGYQGKTGYPIMVVLDDVIAAVLFGSGGTFAIPAGGYLNVSNLSRKGCYRVTLDIVVYPPDRRQTPEAIGARRVLQYEGRPS